MKKKKTTIARNRKGRIDPSRRIKGIRYTGQGNNYYNRRPTPRIQFAEKRKLRESRFIEKKENEARNRNRHLVARCNKLRRWG